MQSNVSVRATHPFARAAGRSAPLVPFVRGDHSRPSLCPESARPPHRRADSESRPELANPPLPLHLSTRVLQARPLTARARAGRRRVAWFLRQDEAARAAAPGHAERPGPGPDAAASENGDGGESSGKGGGGGEGDGGAGDGDGGGSSFTKPNSVNQAFRRCSRACAIADAERGWPRRA
jgi:uncharacterized membrane protein YgcG